MFGCPTSNIHTWAVALIPFLCSASLLNLARLRCLCALCICAYCGVDCELCSGYFHIITFKNKVYQVETFEIALSRQQGKPCPSQVVWARNICIKFTCMEFLTVFTNSSVESLTGTNANETRFCEGFNLLTIFLFSFLCASMNNSTA